MIVSGRACSEARRVTRAMRGEDKLLKLIASIYEAAVEPTIWPGLLERIADAVGDASIALITTEDFDKPIDVWLAHYDPPVSRLASGIMPDPT